MFRELSHVHTCLCVYVQEYLSQCCEGQTLLVVSHDRSFLNAVCQETIELKERQLRCVLMLGGGAGGSGPGNIQTNCMLPPKDPEQPLHIKPMSRE